MKKASLGSVGQHGFSEVVSEDEKKPAVESSEERVQLVQSWGLTWEKLGMLEEQRGVSVTELQDQSRR